MDNDTKMSLILDPRCFGEWQSWIPTEKSRVVSLLKDEYVKFCLQHAVKSKSRHVELNHDTGLDATSSAFWDVFASTRSSGSSSVPATSDADISALCKDELKTEFNQAFVLWLKASKSFHFNATRMTWAKLVQKHVKSDATEDECNSWRNRMKVPLQQVMLAIFDENDFSKVANLSAMLWWSRLGVSISMSSSFGERIASGGSWTLKKTNCRLGLEQISISTCLHMNRKFVAYVKEKYRDELELELNNMIDMRKDNNNVALM